jgi:hypothetical protein
VRLKYGLLLFPQSYYRLAELLQRPSAPRTFCEELRLACELVAAVLAEVDHWRRLPLLALWLHKQADKLMYDEQLSILHG